MKFLSLFFNLFISLASISFGQNSDSLLISADQLFNERKFEESIEIYNTLIKSDSSNAIYFLNRGKAFAQIREYNPALKDLNYSISLVNNNSDSYRTRANIHGRLGNYQSKSIDLQKANKLEVENKQVDTGIIDSLGIKISSSSFNTEYILEIPNTSQSILFVRAGEWMANKYRSAKNVIKMSDKEAGIIVGKGIFSVSYKAALLTTSLIIEHTITINVKDNKFKLNISNLDVASVGSLQSYLNSNKAFMTKRFKSSVRDSTIKELVSFCLSFRDGMRKENPDW